MRRKIIIRSGSLRMGGLERVLIEVLQTINKNKYEIILVIDDDCGEDNVFEKDIPRDIQYYFLKSKKLISRTEYFKERKNNIFYKIMYNLFMNFETCVMLRKMREILNQIGKVELLIDFDAGASKYIDKLDIPKKIVWIHNSIPRLKKKKSKILRFGQRLAKYDKIVAICDEMKEELQGLYPNIREKIIRIYNPFNFERINTLKQDTTELSDDDTKLIREDYCLAISRLDTVQKDFETLIRAFAILKEKGEPKKLFIIGDGPDREKIKEIINKYKLENEVRLLGQRKNPYVWLENAAIFVHSSKYEGLPTVLIEALICNKLVISSDCPTGPKEILENGHSGILYDTGESQALADIIVRFYENNKLKDQYLQNIYVSAKRFEKHKIINSIEKLIDSQLMKE